MDNKDQLRSQDRIIKSQGEELLRYQTYSPVETDIRVLILESRLRVASESAEEFKESRDYWVNRCLLAEDTLDANMKDKSNQRVDALLLQIKDYQESIVSLERQIERLKTSGTMRQHEVPQVGEADEQK